MCGRVIERRVAKIVYIEGAKLTLCPHCHSKVTKNIRSQEVSETRVRGPQTQVGVTTASRSRPTMSLREDYEVVEDYADRVKKAREALGWTQKALAEAVRESENVIKRIESGRLVPSIDLARRLEKVLNIKLLEPAEESSTSKYVVKDKGLKDLTLGDVVTIRKKD